MRAELTEMIVKRLQESQEQLKSQFFQQHAIKVARYFVLDNLLPVEIAHRIYENFPKPSQMHLLSSSGKIKLKYSHLKDTTPLIQDINAAIQQQEVVQQIEEITKINNQIPDPTRFAGGISTLLKGYYLNPHIDNSHDVEKKQYYRTVNLLYYVSPNWKEENGGNYELWDEEVENSIVVPNYFNRLVVMETNRSSWHAVNPVLCNEPRCCVFNYFFSAQSPENEDYFFNNSSFRPRPEQKFRRTLERLKNSFAKRLYFKLKR